MRQRLLEINPAAIISAHKLFYLPDCADDVDLSVYDYVIDAVDTVTAKIELVRRCTKAHVPVICSMGAANILDPTTFEVADIYSTSVCPLARIMRKELRRHGIESLKVVYSKATPVSTQQNHTHRPVPASISFVPPVAGLILAGEVIKDLIKHPL
jgi:tRNA A37 threonylcarbamoyladenosine dehydratase